MLLAEVLDELGTSQDFIGHVGGDDFVAISTEESAPAIIKRLKEQLPRKSFHITAFSMREQGYIHHNPTTEKKESTNNYGDWQCLPSQFDFVDISEITELAEVSRQRTYEL